eukprot:10551910-Alexandrium_andersonii.AAC.1
MLRSVLEKSKNRTFKDIHVSFTQSSHEQFKCEIPDWADFTKSVLNKQEVRRAMQCGRSGRPAEGLP